MFPYSRQAAAALDTAKKTYYPPIGFHVMYQPYLLKDALIEWSKHGYSPAHLPDIEAIAYRNLDLERDMIMMLALADWHNTPR